MLILKSVLMDEEAIHHSHLALWCQLASEESLVLVKSFSEDLVKFRLQCKKVKSKDGYGKIVRIHNQFPLAITDGV